MAKFFCLCMIGIIIYFIGMFSGAAMIEKNNEMYTEEANKKANEMRKQRRIRFEQRHLKGEA